MVRGFPQLLCSYPPTESGLVALGLMPVLNLTQPLGLSGLVPRKAVPRALPAACIPALGCGLLLSVHPLPVFSQTPVAPVLCPRPAGPCGPRTPGGGGNVCLTG